MLCAFVLNFVSCALSSVGLQIMQLTMLMMNTDPRINSFPAVGCCTHTLRIRLEHTHILVHTIQRDGFIFMLVIISESKVKKKTKTIN